MRKLLLSILAFFIYSATLLAQSACNKIEFSGAAPAIWSINGQINDWETILGPGTGNTLFPFNPPVSTFNYFNELSDLDTPDPARNLRFLAFIHDDYNVYFYFRRLQNGNAQNTFFYFFDINLDGLMNLGEPVIYANFNSKNISSISLGSYLPNTLIDYDANGEGNFMAHPAVIPGCFVDGYSMQGEITEIFNSSSIPALNTLQPHEVFSAAITEDGFGVEFAIPWSYLKNWVTNSAPLSPTQNNDLFTYRLSLQNGAGKYQPHKISDNVGGKNCGSLFPAGDLAISGFPSLDLQNSFVQTLSPGSFRIELSYQNTSDITQIFNLGGITLKNIEATEGSDPNVSGFIIKAYIDKTCNHVIDSGDPVTEYFFTVFPGNPDSVVYSSNPQNHSVGTGQTVCIIIDIRFPVDNSVKNAEIHFAPRVFIQLKSNCPCDGCAPLDGGKPINPIGFTLGDEETTSNNKVDRHNSEYAITPEIRVYPNPSTGTTNVIFPNDEGLFNLTLTDYIGRVIQKWSGVRQRVFKLENLKPGFYLLSVATKDNNKVVVKKIIVQ